MNIAVINLKDIIKYAISFILVLAIFIVAINVLKKQNIPEEFGKIEEDALDSIKKSSLLHVLTTELPLFSIYDEKKEIRKANMSESILSTQLAMIHNLQDVEIDELEEGLVENSDIKEIEGTEENKKEDAELIKENVPEKAETQIISQNNINARYTDTTNSVQINNQTSYDLNDIFANANYELTNKDKVIIYHTHTCESYTPSDAYNYEMTGVYRTTDLNFTVSRVGDELEKYLIDYGKTVVHDKTYHDYPAYNGSYGRSLKTMTGVLENNKDAEITIDLHRDAVGSSNTYGPTVKIGDEVCAQVMFVIGSDGSGLYHPNWRENLKYAIMVQEKANEMYPRII